MNTLTIETIEDVKTLREGWHFEAKHAQGRNLRGELPNDMWETYSAFANTEGGYILLGAKELEDGELQLDGIIDIDRVEQQLWNHLDNRQKVSANIISSGDVKRLSTQDGKTLLLIHVPKASYSERPISINHDRYRVFLRVREADRLIRDHHRVDRMYADRSPEHDAEPLSRLDVGDLDEHTIKLYRRIFTSRQPEHPFVASDDLEFLRCIGAVGMDRATQKLHPNRAGLWMFGTRLALIECFPHWNLDYQEHLDSNTRWSDRIHDDGTWQPNLFQFYNLVIKKLWQGINTPFSLDGSGHRADHSPAHQALREALINTLIHADYRGRLSVKIEKKPHQLTFTNPGLMLISQEQLWQGGISHARNPALHKLFSLLQLSERAGSGGPAIQQAWRQQHLKAPSIEEDMENDATKLTMPTESLYPKEIMDELVARLGALFTQQNELGRLILLLIAAQGAVSNKAVQENCTEHTRDITLKLGELVRQGIITSQGKAKGMTYTFAPPYDDSSAPYDGSSAPYDDSSAPYDDSSAPYDDSAGLIERVRNTRRAPTALIQDAILAFCQDFKTSEQIAKALGRHTGSVKNRYLPSLVERGALVLRYPSNPTHPQQAYKRSDA